MQLYEFLSKELSISKHDIHAFENSCPLRYKVYTIPKRSSGHRVIAHPSKKLKAFQRVIIRYLEPKLKIHKSAFAYVKRKSIKQNAELHVNSKYILKMDFQDFFHSITPDIRETVLLKQEIIFNKLEFNTIKKILFWSPSKKHNGKLILSIGAPSSPIISNTVMYFFDCEIEKICSSNNIIYSRYADDITFSTNKKNQLFDIPKLIRKILSHHFNLSIRVNEKKTKFSSKGHNRHITGITITNDNKISVGRGKKREVSSLIHKFSLNHLNYDEISSLQGQLSHCFNIEPELKLRFSKKYSNEVINKLLSFRNNNDK